LPGDSRLDELAGSTAPAPAPAYAWLDLDGRVVEAVLLDEWKLIRTLARARDQPPWAVYHLGHDPGESADRGLLPGTPVALLRALLRSPRFAGRLSAASTEVVIDDELRERLRAVGYLP
jgi:hypothetical protein